MSNQTGLYPPPFNPSLTQYNPANFVNTDGIDYMANDARYLKKNGDTETGVLTITSLLNHNYQTLPTYLPTSIGYTIYGTLAGTTMNSGITIYNLGLVSNLEIGSYLCIYNIILTAVGTGNGGNFISGVSTSISSFSTTALPYYCNYKVSMTHNNDIALQQSFIYTQQIQQSLYLNYKNNYINGTTYQNTLSSYSFWSMTRIA